jgi:hypothetical protein
MKKEVADKWIAALRSGEYKQTKGHLNVPEEFTLNVPEEFTVNNSPVYGARTTYPVGLCCLGVLCEVAIKEGVAVDKVLTDHSYSYDMTNSFLPASVMLWAGMKTNSGDTCISIDGEDVYELTVLNDDKGYNFNEIADHIAKYWEHL